LKPEKIIQYILLFCFLFLCVSSQAQLKAKFSVNILSGCTPLFVQFMDSSTGNPTQWIWDLGNGTTSTVQNPGIIYTNPGVYSIKLIVKNSVGQDSVLKSNYINVYALPDVQFSFAPTEGCPALNVQFNNKSTAGSGTITEQIWDFGDNEISTDPNPLHAYTFSDTFGVTLTVTNNYGCKQTLYKDSSIKVNDGVTANFNYSYINACQLPVKVDFHDLSLSNSTLTYNWSFGDNTVSDSQNPTHTYTQNGTYHVQLFTTTNSGCTDTLTKDISIGKVIPDFLLPSDNCENVSLSFINNSSPDPISATWSFGDGGTANSINAGHTYTVPGSFQIKMTADFGNCTASLTKDITILEKPVPGFTASGNLATCITPNVITFNNTSSNAVNYKWFFGDGDSSLLTNPSHTYNKSGYFTVTLIAFNTAGCSDTLVKTDLIKLGPPQIFSFENLPLQGCVPQTITTRGIIQSSESIVSYLWDFGDGSVSTNSLPVHTYTIPGNYSVTLTVKTNTGCSDTLQIANAVLLGTLSSADFTTPSLNVCASTPVPFRDISNGSVTSRLWSFGDGTTSAAQNPKHLFRDTGFFTVTLKITNNGCSDSITKINYVYINPPVASFKFKNLCNYKFSKKFIDSSIGAKSWNWDFGDGKTSTKQNIWHTYSTTGTFTVKLTVSDGSCTDVMVDTVKILDAPPYFVYTNDSECAPDSIKFTVLNIPSHVKYFGWNFDDGFTDGYYSNSISHTYTNPGNFEPHVNIHYANGCVDTIRSQQKIIVYGTTANFSNPEGSCNNKTISFTDLSVTDSIHPITKWVWDYGDTKKDTLTAPPFQHTYNALGTFDVKLVVYNSLGCKDSATKTSAVIITKPVADFILDSIHCISVPVSFINTSSGLSLSYRWNFGDGTISTDSTPQHKYSKFGSYSVKLIITDKFECMDSISKTVVITFDPKASFTLADTFALCPPLIIQPKNSSQNFTSVTWNFADGTTSNVINPVHYYNAAGEYNIVLIAQGYGGCYDTAQSKIVIMGPIGTFNYTPLNVCALSSISFSASAKNTVEYIWDFNNGITQKTTDSLITYSYRTFGKYLPKLILVDSAGCRVGLTNNDTIKVSGVIAGIKIPLQSGCDSTLVSFADSSMVYNDTISSYQWYLQDNTISNSKNPSHYYKNQGIYNISLKVTTIMGCKDSLTVPVTVKINNSPQINLTAPDSVCIFSPVNLNANEVHNDTSLNWKWNFGNGNGDVNRNTVYTYYSSGAFNVYVSATNQYGCSDTLYHTINVIPQPNVNAGSDTFLCLQNKLTLQASGANTYLWSTDPSLSCTNCPNPVAQPLSSATYYVQGANGFGCLASDSVYIEVIQPGKISISSMDSLCAGQSVQIVASGEEIYNWQPPSGLSNTTIASPFASPTANTTYRVIGSDRRGCFADTAFVNVHVLPLPAFNIIDTLIRISLGSAVRLKTTNSSDIIRWIWTPSASLSCNDCAEPIAQPVGDITYTAQASTAEGCTTSDKVTIRVLCNGLNIFVPNTFSPNNDGMNDWFFPRSNSEFRIRSLRIFNRLGQPVFEKMNLIANNERDGWNGNFNGKPAAPDVYVYLLEIICTSAQIYTLKGTITLIR